MEASSSLLEAFFFSLFPLQNRRYGIITISLL